tara:strand:- start:173 stop:907 length:735 start_codon:yes stop_codon:yes gene_type:complete
MEISQAAFAAILSQTAYADQAKSTSVCKQHGFKSRLISNNGAEVLVAKNRKELWFAFRGTEPTKINDVMADLKVVRNSAIAGGKVHSGFQDELNELWIDCLKEIEYNSQLKNPKKVYFTGHSLGAALATIAATRTQADKLYTFGSPRVGGRKFAKNLKCPHERYVNNNDIVTKVPPTFLGFVHCGEERYFNAYGLERSPTYWQRWKDVFRGIWSGWKGGKFFDMVTDHGMGNYVRLTAKTDEEE